MEDIRKTIKGNDILIFIVPNKDYTSYLMKIAKNAAAVHNKICYISMNRPHDVILREFGKAAIDARKFFFIDCVGRGADGKDVVHVSSPKALTELNITISRVLGKGGIESSLFDSLSTLLIYEDPSNVIKFVHSIISVFRNSDVKAVFTCLKGDVNSELIKDLGMFVDKIVELN
jgi:hypothetical protein